MSSDRFLGGEQTQRSVEASASQLKRLFLVERETMRALGAWHISIANWELKATTPKHLWQDSLHADALRNRVLELRYPKRDVDRDHDPDLAGFLELLTRARTDAEFGLGLYRVVKPALIEAYRAYLAGGDASNDAPSFHHISHILIDEEAQLAEAGPVLADLPPDELAAAQPWVAELECRLARIGGILGTGSSGDASDAPAFSDRPAYEIPRRAVRDPRFAPAVVESPLRATRTTREEQVWYAIDHANEVWAAEVPGAFLWQWRDLPWAFSMDVARWGYDEMRHSLAGTRRLDAWGFELGVDYPMVGDPYHAILEEGGGLFEVLALLYYFEKEAPALKQRAKKHFDQLADTSTAQDTDYDWADEAIHLRYGYTWLMHLLADDKEKLRSVVAEAGAMWDRWLAERWERGEDGYAPFMERIEAKIRAAEVAGAATAKPEAELAGAGT